MKTRFNSKARLTAWAIVTAGLVLPGLTVQPATAAPAAGAKKAAGAKSKTGDARRRPRGSMLRRMKADLNLTDAQIAKLKPIFKASSEQRRAVMENKALTPEQRKARLRQIRAERIKKTTPILTAAQQNKLKQLEKERRKRRAPQKAKI